MILEDDATKVEKLWRKIINCKKRFGGKGGGGFTPLPLTPPPLNVPC